MDFVEYANLKENFNRKALFTHISYIPLLQVPTQVFPQVQSELPQECWQPPGHAEVPGLGVHWPHGGRQLPALSLREHVCP